MTVPTNPSFAIAHLAPVGTDGDKPEESLDFFIRVDGLKLSGRDGTGAYLRAWDDYEIYNLKLTRSDQTRAGHVASRAARSEAQEAAEPAALNDAAGAFTNAAPRCIGHLSLLAEEATELCGSMEPFLGSRVTEMIQLDAGWTGGCWLTASNKTRDLARTEEHGGGQGRLHQVTCATDQGEDFLRVADVFLRNGVHLETGPNRHAIQMPFVLNVRELAGYRMELAVARAPLILASGREPVVWTEAETRDYRGVPHPRQAAGEEGRLTWASW